MRPLASLRSWLVKKLEAYQMRRVVKGWGRVLKAIEEHKNSEEREVIRNTSGIKEE